MKVCLVGHFNDKIDEGVRNVGKAISRELTNDGIEVDKIDISSISQWEKMRAIHPDIIHFILCPTISGLIVTKFISILYPKAKTVISAIQPAIPNWKVLKLFKPDLVLVQSAESEKIFRSLGCKTEFLPNGVDINKFKAVDAITKQEFKKKYWISSDKLVILNLASLTRGRNLAVFKELQKDKNNMILIIGRENEVTDKHILSDLTAAGCTVLIKHFPQIEEIYNLSDCYVFFTVNKKAAIEIPLSVLEAMACNLPVITTKFGALPRLFGNEGDGLFFVKNKKGIYQFIEEIRGNELEVNTREKVLPYSWDNVTIRLVQIYNGLYLKTKEMDVI